MDGHKPKESCFGAVEIPLVLAKSWDFWAAGCHSEQGQSWQKTKSAQHVAATHRWMSNERQAVILSAWTEPAKNKINQPCHGGRCMELPGKRWTHLDGCKPKESCFAMRSCRIFELQAVVPGVDRVSQKQNLLTTSLQPTGGSPTKTMATFRWTQTKRKLLWKS